MTISISDLEHAAAPGWRAPDEARLGEWLLRAASGFTGRANSALAAGDPGLPLGDAIETVVRWYAERGLPPMIAVPYPVARPERSDLDQILAGLGWTVRADGATVMTAMTADVAGYVRADADVAIEAAPDAGGSGSTTTAVSHSPRSPSGCSRPRRGSPSARSARAARRSPSGGWQRAAAGLDLQPSRSIRGTGAAA